MIANLQAITAFIAMILLLLVPIIGEVLRVSSVWYLTAGLFWLIMTMALGYDFTIWKRRK